MNTTFEKVNCASRYLNYDIINVECDLCVCVCVCWSSFTWHLKNPNGKLFVLDLNAYRSIFFSPYTQHTVQKDPFQWIAFTTSKTSATLTYVMNRTFKHTPCAIYIFLHTKAMSTPYIEACAFIKTMISDSQNMPMSIQNTM